ncbi:hypothetical protein K1719_006512 [Acacia pycnantha]|nr:hypothetical protein K1719_006512 [Acacia pycnantha]
MKEFQKQSFLGMHSRKVNGKRLEKGKSHRREIMKDCWLWLPMLWQRINVSLNICGEEPFVGGDLKEAFLPHHDNFP